MKKLLNKFWQWILGKNDNVEDDANDIIEDVGNPAYQNFEDAALVIFKKRINDLMIKHHFTRRQTILYLMAWDKVDHNDPKQVASFFWKHGLSQSTVNDLTKRFMDNR